MAKEYLRYFDPETESISRLTPSNDWWYEFTAEFENLGDGSIENVDLSQVGLLADGDVYGALGELPEISWNQVRLREDYSMYWVDPSGYSLWEDVGGGSSNLVYFLFDGAASQEPALEIEYDGETTYLRGEKIHSP